MSSEAISHRKPKISPVQILNSGGASRVVLVCEHACNTIPNKYSSLGLSTEICESHVAWDPGALAVARLLSEQLDAVLIAGTISRLVYDCNRPPSAPDAMPARSEVFDIPGNINLGDREKTDRVTRIYHPFRDALAAEISKKPSASVLATIHSFTPIYMGQARAVEIGILHDDDSRMADEMLRIAPSFTDHKVMRNQPYGPKDGVTHTLKTHGIANNLFNVMLEIRSDLIATETQQRRVAKDIGGMLTATLHSLEQPSRQRAAL